MAAGVSRSCFRLNDAALCVHHVLVLSSPPDPVGAASQAPPRSSSRRAHALQGAGERSRGRRETNRRKVAEWGADWRADWEGGRMERGAGEGWAEEEEGTKQTR